MLAYITHAECRAHDPGPHHPDHAERLDTISDHLLMSGLHAALHSFDAPLATPEQLKQVHDSDYVNRIFARAPPNGIVHIDADTSMSAGSLNAARRAAGAGILAVELVMANPGQPAFCAVRPPGHHAERSQGMGFCLFNNIAIAASMALEKFGLKRIAIVDWDVHHGNGTEDIFRNDERVLFCSSFQHPFYPFSGHDSDTRNLVDVPLAAGTDGRQFRNAISEHWLPALDTFRPEFIFISAGFDAHVLDDMSNLALTEDDYSWVTEQMVGVASRHAAGRIVSMLEGGYEPGALGRSVVRHIQALLA